MACTSGSVRNVANNTVRAQKEIDSLQVMIEAQSSADKNKFSNQIAESLAAAHVTDATQIGDGLDVKTEYASEFSLNKIAAVVTSVLNVIANEQGPTNPFAMNTRAIDAYADLVNTVAEAAKSSSSASANLSFSMNRLSPGVLAFLYASSVSIKDEDTFGTEAVTTTAIYYRFMQSIDDVRNHTKFGEAIIDAKNLLNMKRLQAALTDELANGKINIDEWKKKDDAYSNAIETIKERLAADRFDTSKLFVLTRRAGFGVSIRQSFVKGSAINRRVVRSAIQRLSKKGGAYKGVIKASEERLANLYY